jgi:hypothetical protein
VRTGLAETHAPIRVYLRMDSTGSPAPYRSLIAYLDLDEMIDDGLAVD